MKYSSFGRRCRRKYTMSKRKLKKTQLPVVHCVECTAVPQLLRLSAGDRNLKQSLPLFSASSVHSYLFRSRKRDTSQKQQRKRHEMSADI